MNTSKRKINNLSKKVRHRKNKTKKTNNKKMNFNYYNSNSNSKSNSNQKIGGQKKTCMCVDYDVKDTTFVNYKDGKKCQKLAVNGTDFCEKHQDCSKFISTFLNSYELDYDPELWNGNYDLKNSHNCYTYFLNNRIKPVSDKCKQYTKKNQQSKCGKLKPQPGDFSELLKNGNLQMKEREYTCPAMVKKVISDNPSTLIPHAK